uniref:Uncharacterized protein n=1 Tax=Mycena chlorophos TaxID=658473 RepID=A0ABQ0L573_MYCCL|nr:predicted protein [Mycena chlorophos]
MPPRDPRLAPVLAALNAKQEGLRCRTVGLDFNMRGCATIDDQVQARAQHVHHIQQAEDNIGVVRSTSSAFA